MKDERPSLKLRRVWAIVFVIVLIIVLLLLFPMKAGRVAEAYAAFSAGRVF